MVETGQLRKNELHGGPDSMPHSSIVRHTHVGDLVELLVNGNFFQRTDGKDEKYAGYIASISDYEIMLSPTHNDNIMHGCSHFRLEQKRVFTKIETMHIRNYRIL